VPRRKDFKDGRGGVLAVLGVLVVLLSCSREPRAEFPERRHDAGALVQGTRIEHAFEVRNRGGADLVVDEVKVNAVEVLAVEGFDRVIPAGGSGRIRVALDTSAVYGIGKLAVHVFTNDPKAPETTLRLDARVVKRLEVEPQDRIYFFKVGEEKRTLVRYGDRPVAVTGVSSDSPHFRPSWRPLAPGERYELTVVLDPATPAGKHEATVTVTTDDPGFPELRIPVRALIS
jgi:Protein of unknown function (DUF1573)